MDSYSLKQTILSFVHGGNMDYYGAVDTIRRSLAEMLAHDESFDILNTKDGDFTLRGRMWQILLSAGNLPETEFEKIKGAFNTEHQDSINRELQRYEGVHPDEDTKDYRQWLTLVCGWLSAKYNRGFHQGSYQFGPLFLKEMNIISAFICYTRLFGTVGHNLLSENSTFSSRQLCDLVFRVIDIIDHDLRSQIDMNPYVLCLEHIESLLSFMRPAEFVPRLMDFVFAYGLDFVVFIEAAFVIENKQLFKKSNVMIKDIPIRDINSLLKKAVEISLKVDSSIHTAIQDIVA